MWTSRCPALPARWGGSVSSREAGSVSTRIVRSATPSSRGSGSCTGCSSARAASGSISRVFSPAATAPGGGLKPRSLLTLHAPSRGRWECPAEVVHKVVRGWDAESGREVPPGRRGRTRDPRPVFLVAVQGRHAGACAERQRHDVCEVPCGERVEDRVQPADVLLAALIRELVRKGDETGNLRRRGARPADDVPPCAGPREGRVHEGRAVHRRVPGEVRQPAHPGEEAGGQLALPARRAEDRGEGASRGRGGPVFFPDRLRVA